jgi:hypothetical protein
LVHMPVKAEVKLAGMRHKTLKRHNVKGARAT